jgi:DNA primase
MDWIQVKYLNLLSSRLQRFKKVNTQYNFRCPICGDSKKNQTKARGWMLTKGSKVMYHCFNCTVTLSYKNFLKKIDPSLFEQYSLEQFRDKQEHTKEFIEVQEFVQKMKVPEFVKNSALKKLSKVSQLSQGHKAKVYVESRKIPTKHHHKIYYCPKFKEWVNELIPDKFEDIKYDDERLVFALLNQKKELIGIQGRALNDKSNIKYITIMLDEEFPKVYGWETIDHTKPIIALEGPIDSLFVENSVASCGGSIVSVLIKTDLPKDKIIIVYDNERRGKETVDKMSKAIEAGYQVAIWPTNIHQKDINDMFLDGFSEEYIKNLILNNNFTGLEAKLNLSMWKLI